MSLASFVSGIFKPAADLIDNLHTSVEEKLALKAQILGIQTSFLSKTLDLEAQILAAKSSIILAEIKSESWITRNWRPIVMLSLMASVMAFWFGLTPETEMLTEAVILTMFGLVKIGLGGYIASRGAEKVIPKVVEALKAREKI